MLKNKINLYNLNMIISHIKIHLALETIIGTVNY